MAEDSIIAKFGADTTALGRALRGVRGMFDRFSEENEKKMKKASGNILQAFGSVAIASGLLKLYRDLVASAREAKEAGNEFHKGQWMSPSASAAILVLDDSLKTVSRTVREFSAYSLGMVASLFRIAGAASATGSALEKLIRLNFAPLYALGLMKVPKDIQETLDAMEKADEKALKAHMEKLDAEAKSLAAQKKKAEAMKVQLDLQEKLKNAGKALAEADQRIIKTKEDRSKLSLQELAFGIQPRFGSRAHREQVAARDVIKFEAEAERQRLLNPELSKKLFSQADEVRKLLSFATEAERSPFGALEESARQSADSLQEILNAATKTGMLIIPRMSK